ncbi:MAG: hypothetical protein AMXMBFR33_72240 [Candidatus Xenobia bacterium]
MARRGLTLPQLVMTVALSAVILLFVLTQAHHHQHPGSHSGSQALLCLVGLVLVALFLAGKAALAVSRTRDLERLAGSLGASFQADPRESPLSPDAQELQLFRLGILPRLENLLSLSATSDPVVSCFDYSYVLRNELGPNPRTGAPVDNRLAQTVVALRWSGTRWPSLKVAGRAWLGEPAGSQKEISLEDAPDFSRHYRVFAEDQERAREALSAEARTLLEQTPGLTVEAGGDSLIVYRPFKLCPPGEVSELIRLAERVAAAMKA